MSTANRRQETLRACDWQPAPREPRKWYDWLLFICSAIVSWTTILALAVRGWNSAPMLVTILAMVAVAGLLTAVVVVHDRITGGPDEPETQSRDDAAMEHVGTQRMIVH